MKFSHSIQFNAVPDWADHYIAYSNLKKLIYQLEKDVNVTSTSTDAETGITEQSPLLAGKTKANPIFTLALDKELAKINTFYCNKEKELYEDVDKLIAEAARIENLEDGASVNFNNLSRSYPSTDGSQSSYIHSRDVSSHHQRKSSLQFRRNRSVSDVTGSFISSNDDVGGGEICEEPSRIRFSVDFDNNNNVGDRDDRRISFLWGPPTVEEQKIAFKKQVIELFVRLSELKSFVSLNETGFSKILKKYEKIIGCKLKSHYLTSVVSEAYAFKRSIRQKLESEILRVQEIYSNFYTNADRDVAINELKTHLREFIVWERNTIWRDIIGLERKSHAVNIKAPGDIIKTPPEISTPFGNLTINDIFCKNMTILIICIVIFLLLLNLPIFKHEEQRNCFALLVFASLLWSTEVMPLFVTSLLIPLLVVCLRVLRSDDGTRLDAHLATKQIFAAMFSPVIMLLLGGFAIAGALSKYHIAKMMATLVLSKAGTKPSSVLLANMFVATFASMWISNVAAPVLCFSLIQPILRNLPSNVSFGRCLIIGIALASNVGGMASPISSPQNIIAIENMHPSPTWIQWFAVAIPLCIIIDILIWALLLWNYKPTKSLIILPIRTSRDPLTGSQIYVIVVTIITIVLWCIEKKLEFFLGDMGIIAIVPLVLFFGTGILTKEDFNNFLWTVIILAMGGIALGKAVYSSGLLHFIAKNIQAMVNDFGVWQVLVVFSILVLVFSTFISHTVAALIILPIVAEVGRRLSDSHPNLLVMGSALTCSLSMGLPVSGFPNMNAIMMEDDMGVRYLTTYDFLKSGVLGSVIGLFSVITIGYVLMVSIGF
ncbi:7196_t:CDS:2 [Entrophospora sp. SA101]|nr:2670_t:CDS:2 [Entrophospora sp. SA101]CAJ0907293.1 7196_t:CDS:2 [Entrophospora sp. SA101]